MTVLTSSRRFLAPEVIQTSAMDCGPASLKCLLEGFGISASYGRLREACQTDVDGTSVDTIEVIANDLGLNAEQVMLASDHLLSGDAVFPCLVVVRHASAPVHFVIVWRRVGAWLQVMDPASGRRWVRTRRFLEEIYSHEMSVPAADWRQWASESEGRSVFFSAFETLGIPKERATALIDRALCDPNWFSVATLDAALRLATTLQAGAGIGRGAEAERFVTTAYQETLANPDDIYHLMAPSYWSVAPDPRGEELGEHRLLLKGAILVRVRGRVTAGQAPDLQSLGQSRELRAALAERPLNAFSALWRMLKGDGAFAPFAVVAALSVASCAIILEALLLRGLFDIGSLLNLGSQRLVATLSLVGFMAVLLAFRLPIIGESMRFGRRLDARLRVALLSKLSRLNDRYFQSRPISDMADRVHNLHTLRAFPALGIAVLQSIATILLTLFGVIWLDWHDAPLATAIVVASIALPLALQGKVAEADLRVRSHGAALHGVQLDALTGLVPIRVHRAEQAIRREHDSLLVHWSRAMLSQARLRIGTDALQEVTCMALACLLIVLHFGRTGSVSGGDLLMVYWVLRLPTIGHSLVGEILQYPAQRNVLLRLLEPLSAPEDPRPSGSAIAFVPSGPVGIRLCGASIVAGGHRILDGIDLTVAPGEHIAVVGPSGAGKSSLLGLLLGWHRLATGEIQLNGVDAGAAEIEALRARTAWVDPAVQLWNRSFLENLTYSSTKADFGRVAMAIGAADLRQVLQTLPDGMQTSLGEAGARLSGGEGQRMRLARAMMQDMPDLVLLDEPFRGMDRRQRARLLGEARQRWQKATLFCVSHDIAETRDFSRVLVVERGTIVEDGTPAVLLARDSRYRAMMEAEQFAQSKIWTSHAWKNLRMEGGRVTDLR